MAGWLDSVVGSLQSGFVPGGSASPFPDYAPPPSEEDQAKAVWEQIQAEEAAKNAAADRRNAAGMARGPIVNPGAGLSAISEPAVSMALGGGMPAPGNPSAPFGPVPPSLALAKAETAPQPLAQPQPDQPPMAGPIPTPAPRPPGADAPTDVSSQARPQGPVSAPMSIAGPQQAPQSPPERPLSDRIAGLGPGMLAVGAALQGDNSIAASQMKQREAQAIQAQQGNATARLLQSRGAKPAEIQAAIAGGPDTVKALLGEYLGKDKWKVIQTGEDAYGQKTFMQQNEADGTLRPIKTQDGSVPAAVVDGADPGLTDAQKNRVQAIIEGREPYPAASRAKDAMRIRDAVHAADPGFDAVNYNSRLKTRQAFTSGKDADNVAAFNTAISHLGTLEKSIAGLNNSGVPLWNKYVANPIAGQTDPKFQTAVKEFNVARTAVSDELTRAFRLSGGNVHDIKEWEKSIDAADTPEQLQAAIRQAAELLNGRIEAVGEKYNRGMGLTKDPLELLHPKAAESFKRILEGGGPAKAPAAAPAVKPGAYIWDPQRGLVPK